jgi:thymidylate kinase
MMNPDKKKPRLICLIGLDGTGKTTLAMDLVKKLNMRGIRAKYVWNGFEPRIMKPFWKLGKMLFLRHENRASDYTGFSVKLKKSFKSPLISSMYQLVFLIDYWIQILVNTRIPLMMKKIVISDRYYYDVLINLTVDLSYSSEKFGHMNKIFMKTCPHPDIVFLIDLSEEIAYERKTDTPSIEFLRERRQLYLNVARQYDMMCLDGTRKFTELRSDIWNILMEEY